MIHQSFIIDRSFPQIKKKSSDSDKLFTSSIQPICLSRCKQPQRSAISTQGTGQLSSAARQGTGRPPGPGRHTEAGAANPLIAFLWDSLLHKNIPLKDTGRTAAPLWGVKLAGGTSGPSVQTSNQRGTQARETNLEPEFSLLHTAGFFCLPQQLQAFTLAPGMNNPPGNSAWASQGGSTPHAARTLSTAALRAFLCAETDCWTAGCHLQMI